MAGLSRQRGNHHGGGDVDIRSDQYDEVIKTRLSSKRQRRSTGGTFNDYLEQCKSDSLSTEEFKAMDMDEKFVTLFKMLSCTNRNTDNLSV